MGIFTGLNAGQRLVQFASAIRAFIGLGSMRATWYVDSVNGTDSSGNGRSEEKPLATVAYALTVAEAGSLIVCAPGGSETLTATLAVSLARVSIVCPVANPEDGYNFIAAGSLDVATVSAAGVTFRGIKFSHTGTTCTKAGILTTAAADKMTVQNCLFDDSAIVTTYQGQGINVIDDTNFMVVDGCTFKDCLQGIKFTMATAGNCVSPKITNSIFYVGQAVAFGIQSAITGSGTVRGLIVDRCAFMEAKGSGAAAATAWDGTNGANATVGPFKFEAAVDQWLVSNCVAFTAAAVSFPNLTYTTGGSVGSIVASKSTTDTVDVTTVLTNQNVIGADVATNTLSRDVIGNKTDAVLTAIAATKSILAYAKTCLQNIGFLADAAVYTVGSATALMAYVKGLLNLSEKVATSATGAMHDADTIFTISGGPVQILALWSECMTGNDGTASTVKYTATPTAGSAQDISAASASIASAAAGASIALAGTALNTAALYNANGPNLVANPGTVIAPAGTIKVGIGVGSTTGTWRHIIRYKPLVAGASVA